MTFAKDSNYFTTIYGQCDDDDLKSATGPNIGVKPTTQAATLHGLPNGVLVMIWFVTTRRRVGDGILD